MRYGSAVAMIKSEEMFAGPLNFPKVGVLL